MNLNLYDHGGHSVGWHADDESLFGKLDDNICIISLSLGSSRCFELQGLGIHRKIVLSGDKDLAVELENKGYDWIRPEVAA